MLNNVLNHKCTFFSSIFALSLFFSVEQAILNMEIKNIHNKQKKTLIIKYCSKYGKNIFSSLGGGKTE